MNTVEDLQVIFANKFVKLNIAFELIKAMIKEPDFIVKSSRNRGFFNTLKLIYFERIFDVNYNTNTTGLIELSNLSIESSNKQFGVRYEGTNYFVFKNVLDKLNINFSNSVFVDFGAGKGRALMMASEYNFKKVIGIEFSNELCDICKNNLSKYHKMTGKKTSCEIINIDATDYIVPDEADVFYFFNPFDETVLNTVIHNIGNSWKQKNREIYIIYVNAIHGKLFEQNGYMRVLSLNNYIYQEYGTIVYKKPGA